MTHITESQPETAAEQGSEIVEGIQPALFSVRSILKNILSLLFSLMGATLLSFVTSWLLATQLGETTYGLYIFMLGVPGVVMSFADLGLGKVVTREMAKTPAKANTYLFTATILRLAAYLILSVITAIAILSLTTLRGYELLTLVVTFTIVVNGLSDLLRSAFVSFERTEFDLLTRVAERALSLFFVLGAALIGISLSSAIFALVAGAVAGILITFFAVLRFMPRNETKFDLPTGKSFLRAGIPMGASVLIISFYARYDVLILGLLRGTAEVARFSIAYSLLLVLSSLSFSVFSALFPVFSRLSQVHRAEQKKLFVHALHYIFVLSIPLAGSIIIAGKAIVLLIYGESYGSSGEILQLLGVALVFMFPSHVMLTVLYAENRQSWVLGSHLLSAALLLIADPILITLTGVYGAALSNILVELVIFCVCLRLTTITLGTFSMGIITRPLAAGTVALVFYAFVPAPNPINLVLTVVVLLGAMTAFKAISLAEIKRLNYYLIREKVAS